MIRFARKGKMTLIVACLLCSITSIFVGTTYADTIFVKEGAGGGGTSWADATGDLRSVLDSAVSGDVIWVAAGTYTPVAAGQSGTRTDTFELRSDIHLYGGFPNTGSPSWGDRERYANRTELSGEILNPGTPDNCYHVLYATGSSVSAIVDGFVIVNGNAVPSGAKFNAKYSASADQRSNEFQAKAASSFYYGLGGGLLCRKGASPRLIECGFYNNHALNGAGAYNHNSSPEFTGCWFLTNSTIENGGGGIYNHTSSPLVQDCVFQNNHGVRGGGGIHNYGYSSPIISDSLFWVNTTGTWGGAIENEEQCSPKITNCIFDNNSAFNDGGAIDAYHNSNPVIDRCEFTSNSSSLGGAVSAYWNSAPQITNSILRNNVATNGGGIYNTDSHVRLINCTLQGNRSGPHTGGGLYVDSGDAIVTNCIFWGDTSGTPVHVIDEIFVNTGSVVVTYSDIQMNPGSPAYPGMGNINQDPLFVDPGSGNFHLSPTSPCIDSGSDSAIEATGHTKDFDYDNRVMNGTVDMGADEFSTGIVEYYLTINSGTGGSVYTPGEGVSGPYAQNQIVPIQVEVVPCCGPCTCYSFNGWTGDIGTIADSNLMSTTIQMHGNYAIEASFVFNWCLMAYDANTNCKIDYPEMVDALLDYLKSKLTYPRMMQVLMSYLTG